jgi:hypothetical protein
LGSIYLCLLFFIERQQVNPELQNICQHVIKQCDVCRLSLSLTLLTFSKDRCTVQPTCRSCSWQNQGQKRVCANGCDRVCLVMICRVKPMHSFAWLCTVLFNLHLVVHWSVHLVLMYVQSRVSTHERALLRMNYM